MLQSKNKEDRIKMMNYYRTRDMLNLLTYFPDLSPVRDLTIIEDEKDYLENKEYLETFSDSRIDTIMSKPLISSISSAGIALGFYCELLKVKEIDPEGVLTVFNLTNAPSKRYERFAGISVGVDLGSDVIIDAVSKGFDGREVSKDICTHERYYIPWFDLRRLSIGNFKDYRTFRISNNEYKMTRLERVNYLKSIGLNPEVFEKYIPEDYQEIPDFIWLSVIRNLIKKLEKNEEVLRSAGFDNFAISGHTEGKEFAPWQMFDKNRFGLTKKR